MNDPGLRPVATKTATILIADDDRAIRTVLTQALGRAGYEVRATAHAATLWRWVEDGAGDLVITDVVMPDENGLDLVPRIKKRRPELRVIVMSAHSTLLTAVKATERGAFDYLPKPFDLRELVRTVERALSEPANAAAKGEPEDEDLPLIGRFHGIFYRAAIIDRHGQIERRHRLTARKRIGVVDAFLKGALPVHLRPAIGLGDRHRLIRCALLRPLPGNRGVVPIGLDQRLAQRIRSGRSRQQAGNGGRRQISRAPGHVKTETPWRGKIPAAPALHYPRTRQDGRRRRACGQSPTV